MAPKARLFQILAPHFCAGGEITDTVWAAAPIIAYMRGWKEADVIIYCTKKGWTYRRTECPVLD